METKPKIKIDIEKAEQYAARGLNNEEICSMLGISERTFYSRMKDETGEFADFADAIKKGRASIKAFVANKLIKKIEEENDTTAMIFFLKTHGWSEKQEIDLNAKQQEPFEVNVHFIDVENNE